MKKTKKKDRLLYDKLTDNEAVYRARQKGTLRESAKTYRIVDLFAGAGGLTQGFKNAFGQVFTPVWANDFNDYAANTYNLNFGKHCTTGDILEIVDKRINEIPKADIVIGGPPCQGFSLLNKQRDGDPRKHLWRPYLQIVQHTGAEIFVMENVPQLLGSEEHEEITKVAREMGFKTAFAKLCAADYGVPQTRWRAFIIGCKVKHPSGFIPPRKSNFVPSIHGTQYVEAA